MSRLKLSVSAGTVDHESLNVLFSNINLVLQHRETVLNTPEYRDIRVAGCGVFLLFVGPVTLKVGDLVRLWKAGTRWLERDGEDTRYVFRVVGSPLSGRHQIGCWSTIDNGFSYLRRGSGASVLFRDTVECRQGSSQAGTTEGGPQVLPAASSDLTVADMIAALKTFGEG